MAITGTHTLLYTSEPEALRACLRDVFGFANVDAVEGWLIFALPPAEMGIHPGEAPSHAVSFMCDDVHRTMADLKAKGIPLEGEPVDQGYGIATVMVLPGGVKVGLYEPRHPTAV